MASSAPGGSLHSSQTGQPLTLAMRYRTSSRSRSGSWLRLYTAVLNSPTACWNVGERFHRRLRSVPGPSGIGTRAIVTFQGRGRTDVRTAGTRHVVVLFLQVYLLLTVPEPTRSGAVFIAIVRLRGNGSKETSVRQSDYAAD